MTLFASVFTTNVNDDVDKGFLKRSMLPKKNVSKMKHANKKSKKEIKKQ